MKRSILHLIILLPYLLFGADEEIKSYFVDTKLINGKDLVVTEEIVYDFKEYQKHGLYRDIPKIIKLPSVKKRVKIDDIKVYMDNFIVPFEVEDYPKTIRLKIGDDYKIVSNKHKFKIEYIVRDVTIKRDGKVYLIFNAIGDGWRVNIQKAEVIFKLDWDSDYKIDKVRVYGGSYGSKEEIPFSWLDDSSIKVVKYNILPYSFIRLSISFRKVGVVDVSKSSQPIKRNYSDMNMEKFFSNSLDYIKALMFIIISFLILMARRYIKKFNNSKEFIGIYELGFQYYPPENLNVLQSALLLDKYINFRAVSGAIIELANLGYLNIIHFNGRKALKRLKFGDANLSDDLRYLHNEILFKNSDEVKFIDIERVVGDKISKLEKIVNRILEEKGLIKPTFLKAQSTVRIVSLFIFITTVTISTFFSYQTLKDIDSTILILIASIFSTAGSYLFIKAIKGRNIFFILFSSFSFFVLYQLLQDLPNLTVDFILFSPIFIAPIAVLATNYSKTQIAPYTDRGVESLSGLLRYKNFIKNGSESEIRKLLERDSFYLDNTFPYALIFDRISDWTKIYLKLELSLPCWFKGDINRFKLINSWYYDHTIKDSVTEGDGFADALKSKNGSGFDSMRRYGDDNYGDGIGGMGGGDSGGGDSW